jgi:hypothetical protein
LAKGLGKVVCKKVGVYEYGWQGVGERWLAKGVGVYEDGWQGAWGQWLAKGRGFMRMLGKGLGEGSLQKGGGL